MSHVSPTSAHPRPRPSKWGDLVLWLDDQGVDLYMVSTITLIIIIIIIIIIALYIALYISLLLISGDEDSQESSLNTIRNEE